MLRATLVRGGASISGARAATTRAQWVLVRSQSVGDGLQLRRWLADGKKPDEIVMPGSQSKIAPNVPNPPPPPHPQEPNRVTPATPESSTIIPPENVPKTPPAPGKVQTAPPTSIPAVTSASSSSASAPPPPPTPPPAKPRRLRRLRRYLLILSTLLVLGYAGGVYASLVSDAFHDFFTEFIPFGEEAVLYFEEREFKKRFPAGGPTAGPRSRLYPQVSGENKVKISGSSGASARPTQEEAKSSKPSKSGATASDSSGKAEPAKAKAVDSKPQEKSKAAVEKAKDASSKAKEAGKKGADAAASKAQEAKDTLKEKTESAAKAAESKVSKPESTPPAAPVAASVAPIALIDPLNITNATDPVVQKLAAILNDVITAVNADNASSKYSSTIAKAKDEVTGLADDMAFYRSVEARAAEEKIREAQLQFDAGARELISRIEREQKEQELQWREEYEAERERISKSYEEKLKAELDAQDKVAEQRLRNELLEQDIKLTDNFAASVRERVETERSARLSKLNELSASVADLEDLTGKWNEVIESNLKTQHLLVAVEALRSRLDSTELPKPFLSELVALREIACDDSVVTAAIASMHPTTYQKGIPTPALLIDRFRRVAHEVRKASLLPAEAGVASHATSFVLSKLLFKKQGLAVGEDVESILTRTETLLEEGNLDGATREMNALDGWAKVLSQDWLHECRRVLEVRQALDVIATEARLQSLMVE